ncbi:uncharacterized protein LOC143222837 isoform X3 [Tachypleus tridentatus]|uniref:uncharacterized protein LOC143222837 isoform X3 n=1 Tax=Tachypleus tridentatus TaxID=6853 RepID=UPI003FD29680
MDKAVETTAGSTRHHSEKEVKDEAIIMWKHEGLMSSFICFPFGVYKNRSITTQLFKKKVFSSPGSKRRTAFEFACKV